VGGRFRLRHLAPVVAAVVADVERDRRRAGVDDIRPCRMDGHRPDHRIAIGKVRAAPSDCRRRCCGTGRPACLRRSRSNRADARRWSAPRRRPEGRSRAPASRRRRDCGGTARRDTCLQLAFAASGAGEDACCSVGRHGKSPLLEFVRVSPRREARSIGRLSRGAAVVPNHIVSC
jgi:hypothetical protein